MPSKYSNCHRFLAHRNTVTVTGFSPTSSAPVSWVRINVIVRSNVAKNEYVPLNGEAKAVLIVDPCTPHVFVTVELLEAPSWRRFRCAQISDALVDCLFDLLGKALVLPFEFTGSVEPPYTERTHLAL